MANVQDNNVTQMFRSTSPCRMDSCLPTVRTALFRVDAPQFCSQLTTSYQQHSRTYKTKYDCNFELELRCKSTNKYFSRLRHGIRVFQWQRELERDWLMSVLDMHHTLERWVPHLREIRHCKLAKVVSQPGVQQLEPMFEQ